MEDRRIVDYAPYGQCIPLTCVNHPHLRWSTKNIECVGARSIFFFNPIDNTIQGRVVGSQGKECPCPPQDLRPLTEEEARADYAAFGREWDMDK